MKGNNTFTMNKATLIEALQKYFDGVMYTQYRMEVAAVTFNSTSGTIDITLKEIEEGDDE
jgi:hypothetical protein